MKMKIKKSVLASFCMFSIGMGLVAPITHAGGPWGGGGSASSELLNIVRVNGVGKVIAEPDVAVLTVGVEIQGETSKKAQADNNVQSQKIIAALKSFAISEDDIKTQWYNISPNYDYRGEEGRKLLGYSANHSLNVTIRDLTKVSEILDKVTDSGATNVGNVKYTLENREASYDEARIKAAQSARAKAEKLAKVFGFEVGALVQVEEFINDSFMPMADRAIGSGGGASMNTIQPGDVEIQLTLNAMFAIESGTGVMAESTMPAEKAPVEDSLSLEKTQEEVKKMMTEEDEDDLNQPEDEKKEATKAEEAAPVADTTQEITPEKEEVAPASAAANGEEGTTAVSVEATATESAAPAATTTSESEVSTEVPADLPEPEEGDPQAPVEESKEFAAVAAPEAVNFSEALATTLDEVVKVTGLKKVMPLELELLWLDGEKEVELPALGFEEEGGLGSHQIKVQFQNVVSYLQSKGFKANDDNTGKPSSSEDMRGYEKGDLICSVERVDDTQARTTKLAVSCGQK